MGESVVNVMAQLSEYRALQVGLIGVLRAAHPGVRDWDALHELPRRGTVVFAGEEWGFMKHGAGVRFTGAGSGRIVDPDVELERCPGGIDAWRLVDYFESLGIKGVEWDGRCWPVVEDGDVEVLVQALARAGVLVAAGRSRLFVMA
ncbi:MAG: hypothetical protein IT370_19220 [Deltaproteobacteria bacterium]|nr:hypothetical protein [Deltaproteobacteria bacterium]